MMNIFWKPLILSVILINLAIGKVDANLDIALRDPQLSDKYAKGESLVYDCDLKHFVCTGDPEASQCVRERSRAMLDKSEYLPCGLIKKFESLGGCLVVQNKLTQRADFSRFCMHEQTQKFELNY